MVWVFPLSCTRQKVKQTNQTFLAPPRTQKNKSRYMNLDDLIKWAQNLMNYHEKGDFSLISKAHCIEQLVLSQLRYAGYDLVAEDLEPLLGDTYPNKLALSEVIHTFKPNLSEQASTLSRNFCLVVGVQSFSFGTGFKAKALDSNRQNQIDNILEQLF